MAKESGDENCEWTYKLWRHEMCLLVSARLLVSFYSSLLRGLKDKKNLQSIFLFITQNLKLFKKNHQHFGKHKRATMHCSVWTWTSYTEKSVSWWKKKRTQKVNKTDIYDDFHSFSLFNIIYFIFLSSFYLRSSKKRTIF